MAMPTSFDPGPQQLDVYLILVNLSPVELPVFGAIPGHHILNEALPVGAAIFRIH